MSSEYNSYYSWFCNYVNRFRSLEANKQDNIKLKFDHTLRVCNNTTAIAHALNLNSEKLFLAKLIALFHDIGRFEQFDKYRTFSDPVSLNHATLGLRILNRYRVLSSLTKTERYIICRAIWQHNKYKIREPDDFSSTLLSKLIRDADKLDILYIITNYYKNRASHVNPALDLGLLDKPGFSEEAVQDILNYRMVKISDLRNLNDLKLLHLSWIYDINFPLTTSLIIRGRYLEELIHSLPESRIREEIDIHIRNYLNEKWMIQT